MADAAGGAGASPAADVHFKLCKKVAQLTKVIYHLNIRNEDHEEEVSALTRRHDAALKRVSADAEAKVAALRAGIDAAREAAKAEAQLTALREQYNKEKEEARATFARREKEHRCASVKALLPMPSHGNHE
jgi:Skp family chaperone for outer membrane proteins